MTKRITLRVLAGLAVVMLLTAGLNGAQERPSAAASGMAEARAHFRSKRFQETLAILRPLAKAYPGRKDVLFLIGLAAIQGSQLRGVGAADREALLDEAITALRAMLIDQPGLLRVRLELARAFFYKGEDSLSQEHFERVLAGNPPEPVVANVRVFLSRIRARRRWNVHLGFAVAPATNIGGTSEREDHLHLRAAVPPGRGVADDVGRGVVDMGWRGVPASVGGPGPAPAGHERLAAGVLGREVRQDAGVVARGPAGVRVPDHGVQRAGRLAASVERQRTRQF